MGVIVLHLGQNNEEGTFVGFFEDFRSAEDFIENGEVNDETTLEYYGADDTDDFEFIPVSEYGSYNTTIWS